MSRTDASFRQLTRDGLWKNNPALVQILGLCPLLAVTSTVVNAIGLGIATTLVMIGSNVTVSAVRHHIRSELRIPVFVLVIAAFVTAVELAMNAWLHELYTVLGIFIPLIVTNCVIIARVEAFASKNTLGVSFWDGLMMGFGFTVVLVLLGAMRELIGQGTLFSQAHLMFGAGFEQFQLTVIEDYRGFLLAILPPGAFLGLAMIVAGKNAIDQAADRKQPDIIVTRMNEKEDTPAP